MAARGRTRTISMAGLALASLVAAACHGSASGPDAHAPTSLTLYTCVTDTTQKAVLAAFAKQHPDVRVQVFRAPTGEINARVAGDVRSGGLRADVVWACDPLTVEHYAAQGLVGGWAPPNAGAIPAAYRTRDAVGGALLYVVAVHHTGTPAPTSWSDLATPAYRDAVALADPSFAASALGAFGWFAQDPSLGTAYLTALKANGAVVVKTPDEVTTGVAQGVYRAGITISSSANAAKKAGSPVEVVWPKPGAIAVWGPVALSRSSKHPAAAKDLITFVVSRPGQQALASTGAYPTLPGVSGPPVPAGAAVVSPDWAGLGDRAPELLADYRRVFGG
ncbi:MAG: extracellular solute-binding protein [Oryzihumus sp.]